MMKLVILFVIALLLYGCGPSAEDIAAQTETAVAVVTETAVAEISQTAVAVITETAVAEITQTAVVVDTESAGAREIEREKLRLVLGVCSGRGIPNAASYSAGSGGSQTIALVDTVRSIMPSQPPGWEIKTIEEIQLVACIGESVWKETETCDYTGGFHVVHRREVVFITVYEARSGFIIDSFEIQGDTPGECSYNIYEPSNKRTYINGSKITYEEVRAELERFFAP